MRHRVMYVVQRACRAGQRGTERTCENGADRQFRNTFRKNGSIREIRKEIATIREENLGIVGNERRKGLSGGNGGTAGRRRHQSASRAVGRADGRSEKRNTCESAANGAKQRIWHGAISLLCGHQWCSRISRRFFECRVSYSEQRTWMGAQARFSNLLRTAIAISISYSPKRRPCRRFRRYVRSNTAAVWATM